MLRLSLVAGMVCGVVACGGHDERLTAAVRDAATRDLVCDVDDIEVETSLAWDGRQATAIAAGCGRSSGYRCRMRNDEWACFRPRT